MLKNAFEKGAAEALQRFGLAKEAAGFMPAARNFLQGQAGHLGQLGQGLEGMLAPAANPGLRAGLGGGTARASAGAAQGAARDQAWGAVKGLAPSIAGLGAAGLGAYALSGNDDQQQRPRY